MVKRIYHNGGGLMTEQFVELALLLAEKGFTIVSFETNGVDVRLALKKVAGSGK
jgi:hypothetical protein